MVNGIPIVWKDSRSADNNASTKVLQNEEDVQQKRLGAVTEDDRGENANGRRG